MRGDDSLAGGVELGAAPVTVAAPVLLPEARAFFAPATVHANAPLDFLLLEHAPPARA